MKKTLLFLTASVIVLVSCSTVNQVGDGVLDTTGNVVSGVTTTTGQAVTGVANTAGTAMTGAGRAAQGVTAPAPSYY